MRIHWHAMSARKRLLVAVATLALLAGACAGATVGVGWGVSAGPGPYGWSGPYPNVYPPYVSVYGRPY